MAKRTNLRIMVVAIMVVLIGVGSAWADLTDGLVAHWKLDGDANDSAGSNDGTLVGDPCWVAGKIGDYALDFDGDGDYVDCGNGPSLNITEQITVSVWIKKNGFEPEPIVSKWDSTSGDGNQRSWILGFSGTGNGKIDFIASNNGHDSGAQTVLTTTVFSTGVWYHVAGTYDGTNLGIWVNGILENTASLSPPIYSSNDKVGIGSVLGTGIQTVGAFDGIIDDVHIYDRALSAEEVEEPYHGQLLSLEVVGPDEVAENFQAQYKAIAYYDNDSTQDVTDLAEWSVEPNDIAGIVAGLLTTEPIDLPEDITITARYTDVNTAETQKIVSVFAICPSGSALEFDGVDDYILVSDSASAFDFEDTTFTVSLWFKTTANNQVMLADGAYLGGWAIADSGAHGDVGSVKVVLKKGCSKKDAYNAVTANTYNNGLWHHVVAIITTNTTDASGNSATVYMDGAPVSLSLDEHIYPYGASSDSLFIARRSTDPIYYTGGIDDIRIYNRALSAEDIRTLMHSRPEAGEPNLVAYWDFDEGEGQVAGDSAGGNHGTLGSTPDVDSSDPNWVDSDAPVGICTLDSLLERNISNVLDIKAEILDLLDIALSKEDALLGYMDDAFHNGQLDNLNKGDVVKAKQKVMGAIQQEEQAETAVDQSIEKLDDALNTLAQ